MTEYVLAKTKEQRDQIYTKLYPTLEIIMVDASASLPIKYDIRKDDEMLSDLRIFLYEKVLNKITLDQIDTAQSYIWVCSKNRIQALLNTRRLHNRIILKDIIISDEPLYDGEHTVHSPIEEPKDSIESIHKEIDSVLAYKIAIAKKQRNRRNTLFLLLLRGFLLDNQYDERGAQLYLSKMLRVQKPAIQHLMYSNGIKSFLFLKKK